MHPDQADQECTCRLAGTCRAARECWGSCSRPCLEICFKSLPFERSLRTFLDSFLRQTSSASHGFMVTTSLPESRSRQLKNVCRMSRHTGLTVPKLDEVYLHNAFKIDRTR